MLYDGGSLVLCVQFSFGSRKKIKSENLLSRLSLVKTIFHVVTKGEKRVRPIGQLPFVVCAICSILWPDLCVDSSRTSLQFHEHLVLFCFVSYAVAVIVGCGSSLLLVLLIGRPGCFFYSFFSSLIHVTAANMVSNSKPDNIVFTCY